jgi:hypothetical protein
MKLTAFLGVAITALQMGMSNCESRRLAKEAHDRANSAQTQAAAARATARSTEKQQDATERKVEQLQADVAECYPRDAGSLP